MKIFVNCNLLKPKRIRFLFENGFNAHFQGNFTFAWCKFISDFAFTFNLAQLIKFVLATYISGIQMSVGSSPKQLIIIISSK